MNLKLFARVVSVCLAVSLLLAGTVQSQTLPGSQRGASPFTFNRNEATQSIESEIQPANSNLFEPYYRPITNMEGWAVGAGDFNTDGKTDVAIVGKERVTEINSLYILLQNDSGGLAAPVTYPSPSRTDSLAVGDLNHDGRDDVVTANYNANTISVYLQQENGTMAARVTYEVATPEALVCGDFNNDGWDDVAVAQYATTLTIFEQQENGTLSPVSYTSPLSGYDDIDTGDLDNDGLMDVVKMNGQGMNPNLSVYLQDDLGNLADPVSYDAADVLLPSSIAVGDVNNNGRQDVVMFSNGPAKLKVWAQNSSGVLVDSANYNAYQSPTAAKTADVNGDGMIDVLTVHTGWMNLGVFLQNSGGGLNPYELYPIPYGPYNGQQGLDIADVNSDGLPDALLAAQDQGLLSSTIRPQISH